MPCGPGLAEAERLAADGQWVPVWLDLAADLDTPVTAYLKLKALGARFLLESVEGGERQARYSYLGLGARQELIVPRDQDPWAALRDARLAATVARFPDLPPFLGGLAGWLGFDSVRFLEPTVGSPPPDDLDLPEGAFVEPEILVAFDHARHRMVAICLLGPGPDIATRHAAAVADLEAVRQALAAPLVASHLAYSQEPGLPDHASTIKRAHWDSLVERCLEHIRDGDIFQIVLSQRLSMPHHGDAFTLYRHLRMLNPSPYMYFFDWGAYQLVGSSPEVLVRLDDGIATVRPIAGTRRRGAQPDEVLAADLLADPKECAEHLMLVDLGRNDLGRVCEFGSVTVDQYMTIEKYSHVLHIVSNVRGRLASDMTGLDLLASCFPAGTLSGAPKVRAIQLLNQLEPRRRGSYGGAVGVLGLDGSVNMGITIRTILLKDGLAHVQAGAGIVADSSPAAEFRECLNKAEALLVAVARAR